MIKKLRVAVDHGNRNMKTCNFVFTTGLTEQDKKPARGEKYLKYQGKYYTLSEKRIPYQRDKTQDSRNRFWILTLFAIAMELEQKSQIQPEDVIQVELPIGLPPKHFAELCERYERYFKGDGKVQELCFNDKVYHLCIQNVMAFPQDYAAMMTRMMEIREIPKVVGIDIGGFTSDYLLMRSGRPDMDYCDSLEKGVITMYNDIISSINSEYDMLLEEADIDSIIKGKTQYYEEAVVQAVETMVQNFVTDLLNSIRERGIDTKSTYTVFNNREPFVVPNSVKVVNGQYVENDIPIVHWGGASSAVNTYYNNASNYAQYRNWILPKDYLKLREITLSYSLPKAWLKQTPFSMVQVSLIGRNLFMWTPKKNNYVDPEGTNYGNDILSEIGEFGAAPTNRTFGGGIKVVL